MLFQYKEFQGLIKSYSEAIIMGMVAQWRN